MSLVPFEPLVLDAYASRVGKVYINCADLVTEQINGVDVSDSDFASSSRLNAPCLPCVVTSLDEEPEPIPDDPDPIIRVNVAGCMFCTRRSTLNRLPYFSALFDKWNPSVRVTEMIDRDPSLFSQILRWIRSGLTYDQFTKGWSKNDVLLFDTELVFYGVTRSA